MAYFDQFFPWFGDMLALGGNILILILLVAMLMWGFIFERFFYFWFAFPIQTLNAVSQWKGRSEHRSWYAQQFKKRLLLYLNWGLERNVSLIRMLIIVCPFLGLLGTVLGMLEVFDGMAATGNNSAKTTAAGVSKATVSTMAGMVVAISGLLVSVFLERRIKQEKHKIEMQLSTDVT